VLAYGKAFSWNPDTAGQKLAPLLRRTWFSDVLLPRLQLGPMDEKAAIEELAVACGAGPKYEGQLKMVLTYMSIAGLIRRDGDTLRAADLGVEPDRPAGPIENGNVPTKETPPPTTRPATVSTSFAHVPEGVLRFNVEVNVDMKEFATWRPDRIAAFWAGIAQVLAAKAAVEEKAGN